MPVEIRSGNEVVVEISDDANSLMAILTFLQAAKFNVDRRDITLDNEFLNNIIGGIHNYMKRKYAEGGETERRLAAAMSTPIALGDEMLNEIIKFCRENEPFNDPENDRYNSVEKLEEFLKVAAFPFSLSEERAREAAAEIRFGKSKA